MNFEAHDRLVQAYHAISSLPPDEQATRRRSLFPSLASDVEVRAVNAGGVPAEWVSSGAAPESRLLLYLHGGGYTDGSPATHRELISRLARACAATALTVDYRLAPQHPFPAALDDALCAYRWVSKMYPDRTILLAGDSAGGGLALALLICLRDTGEDMPAAAGLISPWCDLELTGNSVDEADDPLVPAAELRERGLAYAGRSCLRHPLISPLYADLRGLPPLVIQVGEREILRDDACCIAAKAKAAGVETDLSVWHGMTHVWHIWGNAVPQASEATERLGVALAAKIGSN